jgi:hypothetical protein
MLVMNQAVHLSLVVKFCTVLLFSLSLARVSACIPLSPPGKYLTGAGLNTYPAGG